LIACQTSPDKGCLAPLRERFLSTIPLPPVPC
jgi:hypothetical protein